MATAPSSVSGLPPVPDKPETIRDYVAHEKQRLFHKNRHPYKWFLAGKGTGKTTAAVVEGVYQAIREHPGRDGIMVAPTHGLLTQNMMRTWEKLVPRSIWYWADRHLGMMKVRTGTPGVESVVWWRYSSKPDQIAGLNAAWFIFDECSLEPYVDAFNELVDRLRDPAPGKQCQGILIGTPKGAGHWTARTFGTGPNAPGCVGHPSYPEDYWVKDKDYAVVRAKLYDNPRYPKGSDYYNKIINRVDASEDYILEVVEAQFVSRSGAVFPQFKDHHVVDKLPTQWKRRMVGFDPGFNTSAMIVVGEASDGRYYVIEEHYKTKFTNDEHGWFPIAKGIRERHRPSWFVVDYADADGIARLRRHMNNTPIIYGCTKDELGSIGRIQKLFSDNRLYVHKSCLNLRRELEGWSWQRHRLYGTTDKAELGNDHAIDCLRYWAMQAL